MAFTEGAGDGLPSHLYSRYPLRSRISKPDVIPSPARRSRSRPVKPRFPQLQDERDKELSRSCLRFDPPSPSKGNDANARKLVRFQRLQRRRSRRRSKKLNVPLNLVLKTAVALPIHQSSGNENLNNRQITVKKRKAFLARIRSQDLDIDKKCVIRKTESDNVLIRQKRQVLAKKTLAKNQKTVKSITRIAGECVGKGSFGEVSAWELERKSGTRLRVAIKSFDPADGGQKHSRAEASVMMEFEALLTIRMLLWFVPHRPASFPADFPAPAIIMPLFETRNCVSPSLHNLVFENKLIQPTMGWILQTLIHILGAVSKLHKAGWAHGDLHGGNIILQNRKVILIDYSKANRKNRPYVYSLDPGINWVERLDWIEPLAVMGQNCCSRAGDIWSLGKLTEALLKLSLSYTSVLRAKEKRHQTRLNTFVHLSFHSRQLRPDAKFMIEVLRSKAFSDLNICPCQDNCEMLQK